MRLLLIEDDPTLGEGLRDFLRADGHRVDWCASLAATDALRGEPYDALLVDWQLPDGSGLDWLRARRTRGDATPALMLTARDRLGDRITGLDAGADDYLVKPLPRGGARLRAVSRCRAPARPSRASFRRRRGGPGRACGIHRGVRAELTAREWAVPEALRRVPGIVPKAELGNWCTVSTK
jgi:two-component system OmpR family response regulator